MLKDTTKFSDVSTKKNRRSKACRAQSLSQKAQVAAPNSATNQVGGKPVESSMAFKKAFRLASRERIKNWMNSIGKKM